jgi:hypothetical protein
VYSVLNDGVMEITTTAQYRVLPLFQTIRRFGFSRYIVSTHDVYLRALKKTYLEKPKRLIIWNRGSSNLNFNYKTWTTNHKAVYLYHTSTCLIFLKTSKYAHATRTRF